MAGDGEDDFFVWLDSQSLDDAKNGSSGALGGIPLEDAMNEAAPVEGEAAPEVEAEAAPVVEEEEAVPVMEEVVPVPVEVVPVPVEAAPAAMATSSGELLPLNRDEKQRILKGKMKAADDDARAATARQPAGSGGDGKLMGDAIRAHGFNISPRKSKKRKEDHLAAPFWYGTGNRGQSSTAAGTDLDYSFYKLGVVSDALRNALAGLGLRPDDAVAAPQRVYGRMLTTSDRRLKHARLQMSCKCKKWGAEHPIYDFLKPKEREDAEGKGKGLALKTYDRNGNEFDLTCKYLLSDRSIRLNKWGKFLRRNDLVVAEKKEKAKGEGEGENDPAPAPATRDVMLDLWLFRFHELEPEPAEKVGMVILHYRKGDAAHADAAFDEEEDRRRTRMRTRLLQDYDDSTEPGWGDSVAVMEGDAVAVMDDDVAEEGQDDDSGGAKAGEERQVGSAPSDPLPPDADDGAKTEEKEACGTASAEVAASAEPASEAGAPTGAAAEPASEAGGGAAPKLVPRRP